MYQIGDARGRIERLGAVSASKGTAVDPAMSANTYGSAVSLGTTTFAWEAMYVNCNGLGANVNISLDLHLSTSQGETICIANGIPFQGNRLWTEAQQCIPLPLHVPSGSTIYASAKQSGSTSVSLYTAVIGMSRGLCGLPGFSRIVRLGPTTASSNDTVSIGGSAGDISGWTQLSSSIGYEVDGLMAIPLNRGTTTGSAAWCSFQLGTGASGSEYPITPFFWHHAEETNFDGPMCNSGMSWFPCHLGASSELAIRAWTSGSQPGTLAYRAFGAIR